MHIRFQVRGKEAREAFEHVAETIADLHELTGEWVKDRIRQRQALAKEARDVDSRLKKS